MSIRVLAEWLGALLAPYEPIFKVISYVIGPTIAVVAFIWNRKDRRELIATADKLGEARNEVQGANRDLDAKRAELVAAKAEVDARAAEVGKLRSDLEKITEGSQELWKLRPAKPFPEFQNWLRSPHGAKLITFGNLKGGVGKTTLAANFAAFLSEKKNKPVLLIDLDYQGSLSNMLMLANNREQVESRTERLLEASADLAVLDAACEHLAPQLSRTWLVPANYPFAQAENKLLLQWLLQQDGGLDVRFRLASALLRPEVRRRYAAIIFDMPPRMTLGSINALVSSHYFIVPTVLDTLSVEAVGQFLTYLRSIKSDLSLDIDLAGIVGMMTRNANLTGNEPRALEKVRESSASWREGGDFVFKTTVPRRVAIGNAAGESIAYLEQGVPELFDPLFEEICNSVWKGDGP